MHAVYLIRNKINGRCYVGSAKCVMERKYTHFSQLRNSKHPNRRLQKDYLRYGGQDNFEFFVVAKAIDESHARKFENIVLQGLFNPYNINLDATSAKGRKHMPITRMRMSEAAKGRVISAEQRALISKANLGRALPNAQKTKISDGLRKHYANNTPHTAKLTESDVYTIYKLYEDGTAVPEIARIFGMAPRSIRHVVNGTTWRRLYTKYHST